MPDDLSVPFDILVKIAGTDDVYRLDSELDHMRSIELLVQGHTFVRNGGGFTASDQLDANITPSALALSLYYRTHSTGISPMEFWGNHLIPHNAADGEKEKADMIQNLRNGGNV